MAHRLLLLAFLLFILQHSHMHCEARPTAHHPNTNTGSTDATNPTEAHLLQTAITNFRLALFQSIVNLLDAFPNAAPTAGDKNFRITETDLEAPEKIINTSGAGFIYNAETDDQE
jgi:hypothetical protein